MLLAVNMGRPQSPKSVLSRRRSMRRLLLVNLLCIVAFTRNPSWLRVLRKADTFSNPGNTERFRVFYEILPPIIGGFASLMPSSRIPPATALERGRARVSPCSLHPLLWHSYRLWQGRLDQRQLAPSGSAAPGGGTVGSSAAF